MLLLLMDASINVETSLHCAKDLFIIERLAKMKRHATIKLYAITAILGPAHFRI